MFRPRVIPCLLLRNRGLVKTVKFKNPKYLGDPVNIVRIFNDKEVDEIVFLDITATIERQRPPIDFLHEVAEEAFMPLGYGGGIKSLDDVKQLLSIGIEKVIINTQAVIEPCFIQQAADYAGSQSVVASIDVKKKLLGRYEVMIQSGQKGTGLDPVQHAQEMQKRGAGEIFLTSVDRDGTMNGFDLELISRVANAIDIPLVACGGARHIGDLFTAVKQAGASAAAAGSMFVFQGPHRAVLISYPPNNELRKAFEEGEKWH